MLNSKFSIKTKLALISVVASAIVLSVFSVGIYSFESHTAYQDRERFAISQTQIIANNLTAALPFHDPLAIKEVVSILTTDSDFISVQVLDSNGKILLTLPESNPVQSDAGLQIQRGRNSSLLRDDDYFDIKADIQTTGNNVGTLMVRFSYASVRVKINKFAMALFVTLLTSLLLATVVSFRLHDIITKPLLRLLDLIRNISSSKDYSLTISDLGNDEIGTLGHNFNLMLSEINQRDLSLRLSNLSLEGRVQERTRELEAAVAQLNQAQESITLKHKQLKALIASAPIAMAMLDRNRHLLVASTQWKQEYQYAQSNRFGHTLSKAEFPESWDLAIIEALKGETISNSEDSFVKSDGTKLYLRWTIQPWWKEDGGVGGTIVSSENISDLVRARDEALKISQAKSEFLANVSHELRTPLNGILGFSNILQETGCTNEQQEYVDLIKSSSEVLLRVINDVLDFSKLEKSATKIEHLSFSPAKVINDLVRLFSITSKENGLEIKVHLDPDIPLRVFGDEFRLKQVLSNLLGNAIKFTSRGGILISVTTTSKTTEKVKLLVSVKDSGIGIPSDKLEIIFKPFSQADGTVTRRFGGTGLGLAIASELVSLMGSKLEVNSTVDVGSDFFFFLQLDIDPESSNKSIVARTRKELLPTTDSKRILIAEDNAINQKLICRILEHAGYCVELVDNGEKAISAYQNSNFDLIILDLQMPVMGGIEAAMEIRKMQNFSGCSIPIVALTAHAFEEDRINCERAGMNTFLTKPIDRDLLLKIIHTLS